MDEYIKKTDALKATRNANWDNNSSYKEVQERVNAIKSIPAADVVEVRHAHWTWNPHHCKWECSACGGMEGECESPICKWCGARMDTEDEHETD